MGRKGRVYTPKATHEYEDSLAVQYTGPLYEGPIEVHIRFERDHQVVTIRELGSWENNSKLQGDLDNYIKSTLDALNGVAYTDDKLVKVLVAGK